MTRPASHWIAFLAMAFAITGLTGMIASFTAPLPLQRAFARDIALDQALAAAADPARLDALRPRLDDSAAAILPPGPDFPAKIARERAAMHVRFAAEADANGGHLAWMIAIVTFTAAIFGIAILHFAAGRPPLRTAETPTPTPRTPG